MKPMHRGLLFVAVATAIVFVESRLLALRQIERDAAQARVTRLGTEIDGLKREQAATAAQLKAGNEEIAALLSEVAAAETEREGGLRAWARRINQIKTFFNERPEQAIPELGLLTASDWLGLGRTADLDTPEGIRKTLADARTAAKFRFNLPLSRALRRFEQENDGALPTEIADLQSYFDSPVDPAILSRYRMALTGKVSDAVKGTYALAETSTPDEQYDVRWDFIASGGSRVMPWALSEWNEAADDARVAYARANGDQASPNLAALLPYVPTPEVREVMRGVADYQAAHGGRQTTSAAEVLPYLVTPEAKALAEKFWPKRN